MEHTNRMATFPPADLAQFMIEYPGFIHHTEAGDSWLTGVVTFAADGKEYSYEVRIVATSDYPNRFPNVYETVSTFPKILDRHVYGDESFCFTVLPLEVLRCNKGIDLRTFLTEWIVPYLANQQYRKNEGKYANGEFSHGLWGLMEYYGPLVKTSNMFDVEAALTFAIEHKRVERVSKCFCGNGKKYRHCHKKAIETLWEVGDEVLAGHRDQFRLCILEYISKKRNQIA